MFPRWTILITKTAIRHPWEPLNSPRPAALIEGGRPRLMSNKNLLLFWKAAKNVLLLVTVTLGFAFSSLPLYGLTSLTVTPQLLVFNNVESGTVSTGQKIHIVSNETAQLSIDQIGSPTWLNVTSQGPPPLNIGVGEPGFDLDIVVNAQNLPEGTYQGSFIIRVNGQSEETPPSENINETPGGSASG